MAHTRHIHSGGGHSDSRSSGRDGREQGCRAHSGISEGSQSQVVEKRHM